MKIVKVITIVFLMTPLIFLVVPATQAFSGNPFNGQAVIPREVRWEIVGLEVYVCILKLPTKKIYKKNVVTLILARPEKNPSVPFFVKMDAKLLAYFLKGLGLKSPEQIMRKRCFVWGSPKDPVPAINRLIREGQR